MSCVVTFFLSPPAAGMGPIWYVPSVCYGITFEHEHFKAVRRAIEEKKLTLPAQLSLRLIETSTHSWAEGEDDEEQLERLHGCIGIFHASLEACISHKKDFETFLKQNASILKKYRVCNRTPKLLAGSEYGIDNYLRATRHREDETDDDTEEEREPPKAPLKKGEAKQGAKKKRV